VRGWTSVRMAACVYVIYVSPPDRSQAQNLFPSENRPDAHLQGWEFRHHPVRLPQGLHALQVGSVPLLGQVERLTGFELLVDPAGRRCEEAVGGPAGGVPTADPFQGECSAAFT